MVRNINKLTHFMLACVLTVSYANLQSCSRNILPNEATAANTESSLPASEEFPASDAPATDPNNLDSDPTTTDLPAEPTDTPDPLPAPTNPVPANTPMIARAVSKTVTYQMPLTTFKATYITIEVTWQPVVGAKEYWVFKDALPTKAQANKEGAYAIRQAKGWVGTGYIDGVMPPSMSGGSFWDKLKKLGSAITIKAGKEYKYKVFAVDTDGNIIGESDSSSTIPIAAISAPKNIRVTDTNTIKPLFEWDTGSGDKPDGFFVSVFPPVYFGKDKFEIPSVEGFAYWSTFRIEATKVARYGDLSENAVAYPGLLPFNISFDLKKNYRYTVSITSVKTDTQDMRTAKAISKSWSESTTFLVGGPNVSSGTGSNTTSGNTGNTNTVAPSSVPSPSASASSSTTSKGILDTIKGWFF